MIVSPIVCSPAPKQYHFRSVSALSTTATTATSTTNQAVTTHGPVVEQSMCGRTRVHTQNTRASAHLNGFCTSCARAVFIVSGPRNRPLIARRAQLNRKRRALWGTQHIEPIYEYRRTAPCTNADGFSHGECEGDTIERSETANDSIVKLLFDLRASASGGCPLVCIQ